MNWEAVIGLEVHAQLLTSSKIFSGASTRYGGQPNTQACAIDLGLPGVLPVLNQAVVAMAVKFGLAIEANIAKRSVFARKNYFYPDLPKGYQISQYELPIVGKGELPVQLEDGTTKVIGITRAHLEEDAGKSLHEVFDTLSGIDLNRAGIPLLEIVSEPDLRSGQEAVSYLKVLHTLVRYLHICDGNMQEGSFRCDANVSVRPHGQTTLGTRTEVKNVNSFRFVEKAINYEINRQIEVLETGGIVQQETRLYDANNNETRPMRSKEEAFDYRYFPDPDLLPLVISSSFIESVRVTLPELPTDKCERFQKQYGLNSYDATNLIVEEALADYFEATVKGSADAKLAANWIMGELMAALNKHNLRISESPVGTTQLSQLLSRIQDKTISGKIAKVIFEAMWQGEGDPDAIIAAKGLQQVTDTVAIETIVAEVLANNPEQSQQYKAGNHKLFGYFVGQVMKKTRGQADPKLVNEILKKQLSHS